MIRWKERLVTSMQNRCYSQNLLTPPWVMDQWLMHDIVTSCIGHLENTWSLRHASWMSHFIVHHQKITDINITITLIRKDWKYCKVPGSWWQIGVFQNSNSCSKAPILSLATNAVSYSLEGTGSLFVIKKMSVKNARLNNYVLSVVLSTKNIGPWKRWLIQLTTQTITQVPFLETKVIIV